MDSNRIMSFNFILFWKSAFSRLRGNSSVSFTSFFLFSFFLFSIFCMIWIKFSISSRFLFSFDDSFFISQWISLIFSGLLMYSLHFFRIKLKYENRQCPITSPMLHVNTSTMKVHPYSIQTRILFSFLKQLKYTVFGQAVSVTFRMIIDTTELSITPLVLDSIRLAADWGSGESLAGREVLNRKSSPSMEIGQFPGVRQFSSCMEESIGQDWPKMEYSVVLAVSLFRIMRRRILVEGNEYTFSRAFCSTYLCISTSISMLNPPSVPLGIRNLKAISSSLELLDADSSSTYQLVKIVSPSMEVSILLLMTEELGILNWSVAGTVRAMRSSGLRGS